MGEIQGVCGFWEEHIGLGAQPRGCAPPIRKSCVRGWSGGTMGSCPVAGFLNVLWPDSYHCVRKKLV